MNEPLKLPIKVYSGQNMRSKMYLISFLALFLPVLLWWKRAHDPSISFMAQFLLPFCVFVICLIFVIAVVLTEDFADIVINQTALIITTVNLLGRPSKESITRGMEEFDFIYPRTYCAGAGCSYYIIFHARSGSDVCVDAPDEIFKSSFRNCGKELRDYALRLGTAVNLKVQDNA